MLWTVMLEVDNREARTLEGAITVGLYNSFLLWQCLFLD